ncbi:MAG TPA: TIGR03085 family metal-binding protein [Segeticoccus sp.]|uniref:TIGR03085 family metal-binding protein n=1 Tax=Segeticoccus sp. TaxID=2706531 RepID=UPI002D7F1A95|nr:TIGR03085 family metal-binding protein [Segeticoccus sp.]HET8601915.1 TIGR03085 family metal-binding protein [Segeticoccus sp.]
MSHTAREERRALCDTLVATGPGAPTLCEGWLTRDLAAHLVLRERRPDAAAGVLLPALKGRTNRIRDEFAQLDWPVLVDLVRNGPPAWMPTAIPRVDGLVNTGEFFVHHEDVLRAAPGWGAADRREVSDALQEDLWAALARTGRMMFRRSPVGVVLVADGYGRRAVKRPPDPSGDPAKAHGTVVLRGLPGELFLYGFNRKHVAQVVADGEPADAWHLAQTRLGV